MISSVLGESMIKESHLKVGKLGIFTAHEVLWVIHCEGEECELKLKEVVALG